MLLPYVADVFATYWLLLYWLMLLPKADVFTLCGRWNSHFLCDGLMLLPCWIIYRFKCDRLECDEEYIGETSRTFGERFKEHLKAPSPIHDHSNTSDHTTTLDNFKVVGREEQNLSRLIKESMYIRVNGPCLNKNIGKYHLPHMWDEVLNNSRELKLK